MRALLLAPLVHLASLTLAQGPTVTAWIINPGNQRGYGGIASNVQSAHCTTSDVYVTCTCMPGRDIGSWTSTPNLPANQDVCFKITRNPVQNTGTLVNTPLGHIGTWRNGVSIFNAKDGMSYNNQGIWNRDALVFEGISFDACLGHPAPNGEYHHHVSPNCLYDHLNDAPHGDLIGHAFDGFPIYGAHAQQLSAPRHHTAHHPAQRNGPAGQPIRAGDRRSVSAGRLPRGLRVHRGQR